jgi:RNA polymerase sigma-70 factor (ECF subfamily)
VNAGRFPPTRWSLVVAAGDRASSEGREALEALCRACWTPLYAFARRSGSSPADAQDLVQGFFATVLEKGSLAAADPERGRFRTFLIAAFRHHASHERERGRALKRGGGAPVLSLDAAVGESGYLAEPSDDRTPEALYERRWALTLLERSLDALREAYGDRSALFEELRPHLVGGAPLPALAATAERLGLGEGATRVALHRLRSRFRDVLRAVVAETVADPADVDAELRDLMTALSS